LENTTCNQKIQSYSWLEVCYSYS